LGRLKSLHLGYNHKVKKTISRYCPFKGTGSLDGYFSEGLLSAYFFENIEKKGRIKVLFRLSFSVIGRFSSLYNVINGALSEQFLIS
jgi:hypothetical protein